MGSDWAQSGLGVGGFWWLQAQKEETAAALEEAKKLAQEVGVLKSITSRITLSPEEKVCHSFTTQHPQEQRSSIRSTWGHLGQAQGLGRHVRT